MQNKKLVTGLIIVILVVVVGAIIYFVFPEFGSKLSKVVDIDLGRPQVVEEELVIPQTQQVSGTEGRFGGEGSVNTPLVPKGESEKVVVPKAVLTLKGSYSLAEPEAQKWSSGAKPAMIKSLGAVTLEGKSSQWQLVFSSKDKPNKGYEVIVQADQIVSKKEIESTVAGGDFPSNMKDSGDAVKALQEIEYFANASLSAISLYYNTDGKVWRYTLSTSNGGTSMAAQ